MVTPLQLAPKIVPTEELLAKSTTRDFEAVSGSVSFGEILKAKEKELQKSLELNLATVAAALAAMQAPPPATPNTPENGETVRKEARSVLKATAPLPASAQPAAPTSPTVNASALSETDLASAAAAESVPVSSKPVSPPVETPRPVKSLAQPASSSAPAADLPVFGPVVAEAGPEPALEAPVAEARTRMAARQPATRSARSQAAAVLPVDAPALETRPQTMRAASVNAAENHPTSTAGRQPQAAGTTSRVPQLPPAAVMVDQPTAQPQPVAKAPASAHPVVSQPVETPVRPARVAAASPVVQPPAQDVPEDGHLQQPGLSASQPLPKNEPAPARASTTEPRTPVKAVAAQPAPAAVVTEPPDAQPQAPAPVSYAPDPRSVARPQPAETVPVDMLEPRAPAEAHKNEKPVPTLVSAPVEKRQPAPKLASAQETSPLPAGHQPAPAAPDEKLALSQDAARPSAREQVTRSVEAQPREPIAKQANRPAPVQEPATALQVERQPQAAVVQPSTKATPQPVVARPEAQPVLDAAPLPVMPRSLERQPEDTSVVLPAVPDAPAMKPAPRPEAPAAPRPVNVDAALQQDEAPLLAAEPVQPNPVEKPAHRPLESLSHEASQVSVHEHNPPDLRQTAQRTFPVAETGQPVAVRPQPEAMVMKTEIPQTASQPRATVQGETPRPNVETPLPNPKPVDQAAEPAPVDAAKTTLRANVLPKDAPSPETYPAFEQPRTRTTTPMAAKTEHQAARPAPVIESAPPPVFTRPVAAASSPVMEVVPGKPVAARPTQKTALETVPSFPDAEPRPVAQPSPLPVPARSAEFHVLDAPLPDQPPIAALPAETQVAEPVMLVPDLDEQSARPAVSDTVSPKKPAAPRPAPQPVENPPRTLDVTHNTPTLAGEPPVAVSQPVIAETPAWPVERRAAREAASGAGMAQAAELRPGVVDWPQPAPVTFAEEAPRPVVTPSAEGTVTPPEGQPVAARPLVMPQAQPQAVPAESNPHPVVEAPAQPVESPKAFPADIRTVDVAHPPAVMGQEHASAGMTPVTGSFAPVDKLQGPRPLSAPVEKELAQPERPNLAREKRAPVETPSPDVLPTPERLAVAEASAPKVAERGPVALPGVHAAELVEQVVKHLHSRLEGGPTSMHLQLHPAELGAIDVQVTSTAQGVSVSFVTEQASTGRLLETQANQLRQTLTESGVQLAGLNINQHGQPGQQGGFFQQNSQFAAPPRRDVPQPEPVVPEKTHVEQAAGPITGIDYLI